MVLTTEVKTAITAEIKTNGHNLEDWGRPSASGLEHWAPVNTPTGDVTVP